MAEKGMQKQKLLLDRKKKGMEIKEEDRIIIKKTRILS